MKKVTTWEIALPDVIQEANQTQTTFCGFDPGTVHMGIALSLQQNVLLTQLDLVREDNAVDRMQTLSRVMMELFSFTQFHVSRLQRINIIEGAAFSESYRQVELAEARATIFWWLHDWGYGATEIINPISIRKRAFSDIKLRAWDYWDAEEVGHDALAALSCLYYAMSYLKKD